MTKEELIKCPCIAWLRAYERLGNQRFHQEEWWYHSICWQCKIHIDGHGDWCEFCHGTDYVALTKGGD